MTVIFSLLFTFHFSLFTFATPTFAQVNIGNEFGFGGIKSLSEGLGHLTAPAFMIAAIGVTFYFIMGAIKYIMAGDDKNAIPEARAMITHAIIGFLLLMAAFFVVQYVPEAIGLGGFRIIQ